MVLVMKRWEWVKNHTIVGKGDIGMREPKGNKKKKVGVNIRVKQNHKQNVKPWMKENSKRDYKRRVAAFKRKRLDMKVFKEIQLPPKTT